MKLRYFNAIIFLLLFLATAFAGLYLGQSYLHFEDIGHGTHSERLHKALHANLNITQIQAKNLKAIEDRFYTQSKVLEEQIYLANKELSQAIKQSQTFSLQVQEATSKIHQMMGELQKATLKHFFQMRPFLTDKQNQKLEKMITDALEVK